jgi:hypothetical protein
MKGFKSEGASTDAPLIFLRIFCDGFGTSREGTFMREQLVRRLPAACAPAPPAM